MNAVVEAFARRPAVRPAAPAEWRPSPFARDVIDGLTRPRRRIPGRWLYDARGCALFDQIAGLDEFHAARTEGWIIQRCAPQIAELAGRGARVVELGAGIGRSAAPLLDALDAPAAYVPVDLCAAALDASSERLRQRFPRLRIEALVADFTQLEVLPPAAAGHGRCVVLFAGSTIGQFTPGEASALLARIGRWAGDDALLVVGADATADPAVLLPAYDDRRGLMAALNKNLLTRIDRELGGDFSESAFRYRASYDAQAQRVDMQLVSEYTQSVKVLGRPWVFAMGESIHTQSAHSYGPAKFSALAARAGWAHRQRWMDGLSRYAVHVLERAPTQVRTDPENFSESNG